VFDKSGCCIFRKPTKIGVRMKENVAAGLGVGQRRDDIVEYLVNHNHDCAIRLNERSTPVYAHKYFLQLRSPFIARLIAAGTDARETRAGDLLPCYDLGYADDFCGANVLPLLLSLFYRFEDDAQVVAILTQFARTSSEDYVDLLSVARHCQLDTFVATLHSHICGPLFEDKFHDAENIELAWRLSCIVQPDAPKSTSDALYDQIGRSARDFLIGKADEIIGPGCPPLFVSDSVLVSILSADTFDVEEHKLLDAMLRWGCDIGLINRVVRYEEVDPVYLFETVRENRLPLNDRELRAIWEQRVVRGIESCTGRRAWQFSSRHCPTSSHLVDYALSPICSAVDSIICGSPLETNWLDSSETMGRKLHEVVVWRGGGGAGGIDGNSSLYVDVDLKRRHTIDFVRFINQTPSGYVLSCSDNGHDWKTLVDYSRLPCFGRQELRFSAQTCRFVRIEQRTRHRMRDSTILFDAEHPGFEPVKDGRHTFRIRDLEFVEDAVDPQSPVTTHYHRDQILFAGEGDEKYATSNASLVYRDLLRAGTQPHIVEQVRGWQRAGHDNECLLSTADFDPTLGEYFEIFFRQPFHVDRVKVETDNCNGRTAHDFLMMSLLATATGDVPQWTQVSTSNCIKSERNELSETMYRIDEHASMGIRLVPNSAMFSLVKFSAFHSIASQ
jgi:hypothetical protein